MLYLIIFMSRLAAEITANNLFAIVSNGPTYIWITHMFYLYLSAYLPRLCAKTYIKLLQADKVAKRQNGNGTVYDEII